MIEVRKLNCFRILGNTFCIDTGMTYLPFYKVNDKEIIMLDSGWAKGEREGILQILEKEGLHIAGIINTHAHLDHAGNNRYFKEKYGAIIAMRDNEACFCKSPLNMKAYYYGQTLTEVVEHYAGMLCKSDIEIEAFENNLEICGVNFKIVNTPGHSPGHISIITPDDVFYIGDALLSHDVIKGHKMPYAFVMSEDLKTKENLKKIKCSQYVVSHKGIYDDIKEIIDININFFNQRAELIKSMIIGTMGKDALLIKITNDMCISVKTAERQLVTERMLKSYLDYLVEIKEIETIIDEGLLKYQLVKN